MSHIFPPTSLANLSPRQIVRAGFFCLIFFTLPHTASAQTLPETLTLRIQSEIYTVPADTLTSLVTVSTRLRYMPGSTSEIENTRFCPTGESYCDFSVHRRARSSMRKVVERAVSEEAVVQFIQTLSDQIKQEPINARFSAVDGKLIAETSSVDGFHIDIPAAQELLIQALGESESETLSLSLPVVITPPTLSEKVLADLGISSLVGEGVTHFNGSPKNRIYNINRALEQFQGVILQPGEEFSFVEKLGPVDGEHGYLPELVIKHNRTEPEFGGGICQVSSTVFRAAINSGLKITERRNHAYPVQYYKPYGMDATIYVPKPDLKFRNNFDHAIFFQPVVNGTTLTFQVFGKSDGRTVLVDGPHILEHNPDGSMKTVFTQTVNTQGGENFIRDSFYSNYKSPSLFPHPGDEKVLTEKPKNWSEKQWQDYKRTRP